MKAVAVAPVTQKSSSITTTASATKSAPSIIQTSSVDVDAEPVPDSQSSKKKKNKRPIDEVNASSSTQAKAGPTTKGTEAQPSPPIQIVEEVNALKKVCRQRNY